MDMRTQKGHKSEICRVCRELAGDNRRGINLLWVCSGHPVGLVRGASPARAITHDPTGYRVVAGGEPVYLSFHEQ